MVARKTCKQNWVGKLNGVCKQQTRTGVDALFSGSRPGVACLLTCCVTADKEHGHVESTCFEALL